MPNPPKQLRLAMITFVMWTVSSVRAEESGSIACIDSIKSVCAGLDNAMEKCLAERASQLSEKCRDLLKTAMSYVENNSGPATCINDVKQYCSGLTGDALAQCMVEKKSNFSQPCRDFLDAASPKGSNDAR